MQQWFTHPLMEKNGTLRPRGRAWHRYCLLSACLWLGAMASPGVAAPQSDALLPAGVSAVWDMGKAFRETTPTRERICLNGLWQWQPAEALSQPVPPGDWGYFKVPGCWPGISDYMQKDCQTLYVHPSWSQRDLGQINAAWYRRDFQVPGDW